MVSITSAVSLAIHILCEVESVEESWYNLHTSSKISLLFRFTHFMVDGSRTYLHYE